MKRITAYLLIIVAGVLPVSPAAAQQIAMPRIEQMPVMPSPYLMRNWKQVARGYDSLAFDAGRTGQYLPLVFLNNATVNYPGTTSFGLHSYVGDGRSESGEADQCAAGGDERSAERRRQAVLSSGATGW